MSVFREYLSPRYQNSVTIKEKNCHTLLQTTDFPTLPYLVELADSQNVIAVNTLITKIHLGKYLSKIAFPKKKTMIFFSHLYMENLFLSIAIRLILVITHVTVVLKLS